MSCSGGLGSINSGLSRVVDFIDEAGETIDNGNKIVELAFAAIRIFMRNPHYSTREVVGVPLRIREQASSWGHRINIEVITSPGGLMDGFEVEHKRDHARHAREACIMDVAQEVLRVYSDHL